MYFIKIAKLLAYTLSSGSAVYKYKRKHVHPPPFVVFLVCSFYAYVKFLHTSLLVTRLYQPSAIISPSPLYCKNILPGLRNVRREGKYSYLCTANMKGRVEAVLEFLEQSNWARNRVVVPACSALLVFSLAGQYDNPIPLLGPFSLIDLKSVFYNSSTGKGAEVGFCLCWLGRNRWGHLTCDEDKPPGSVINSLIHSP